MAPTFDTAHAAIGDVRAVLAIALLGVFLYKFVIPRLTNPLRNYDGPKPASLFMGNLKEIFDSGPGEAHLRWVRKFGPTVVYNGFLQEKRIVTCDPAALNHILLSRPYDYPKPAQVRGQLAEILGRGVLFAEGDAHKKQRRVLQPAFSKVHIDAMTSLFFEHAQKLKDIWTSEVGESETVIDVTRGLSRLTLDIIGSAGFGANFDTLNNKENKLANAFASMFSMQAPGQTVLRVLLFVLMRYLPILTKLPTKRLKRIQTAFRAMDDEGNKLFEDRRRAVNEGDQDTKDLLSILVKSNNSETAKGRLTDAEVSGQISTILLAGHETTSTALTWTLHLLSSRPQVQDRLRAEIREAFAAARSRGEDYPSPDALQSLPYLDAVTREALRFHPPVASTLRTPSQDDVIPLSHPVKLKNGQLANSIPVRKGSTLFLSVTALNFSMELYGEDADEFRPERWLGDLSKATQQTRGFVAFSPLLTFLGGPRGCIGYRFSIAELKAILSTVIAELAFEPRDDKIEFEACVRGYRVAHKSSHSQIVSRPYIKGELEKGATMPLRVSRAL